MRTLYPILVGLLAAPIGAAAAVLVAYALLALRMGENQGRRGLLAGVMGIPIGLVAGFIAGHTLAAWLRDGGAGLWSRAAAGIALAVPAAVVAAVIGLIAGTHMAEARGVSNYAGERGAWGLFYVALPAAVVIGVIAFLVGRRVVG